MRRCGEAPKGRGEKEEHGQNSDYLPVRLRAISVVDHTGGISHQSTDAEAGPMVAES